MSGVSSTMNVSVDTKRLTKSVIFIIRRVLRTFVSPLLRTPVFLFFFLPSSPVSPVLFLLPHFQSSMPLVALETGGTEGGEYLHRS